MKAKAYAQYPKATLQGGCTAAQVWSLEKNIADRTDRHGKQPLGLQQKGDWYETVLPENKYLYNGKELS